MSAQARAGVWAWVGAGLVIASAACGVIGYSLWAAYVQTTDALSPEEPHMTLRAEAGNGPVEFHLSHDSVAHGVTDLTVLDAADNVLWQVNGHGRGRAPVIVYGQVPVEPDVPWKQTVPADGTPPPDIHGRKVRAVVEWEYERPNRWPGSQSVEAGLDVPYQP